MARRVGRIGDWNNPDNNTNANASRSGGGGPRIATLRDMASSSGPPQMGPGGFGGMGGGGGMGGDDDDDDEPRPPQGDDDEPQSYYTGGERSGLSVQDPNHPGRRAAAAIPGPGGDVVRDLLRRAAEAGPPPEPAARDAAGGFFSGGGHTLGSDEVDSTFIPDPNAPQDGDEDEESAIRHIIFWREGFSVEDGPLMRYDDPQNAEILNQLNSGRAPPAILNVRPRQPVELRIERRLTESYTPRPLKPAEAFSGSGNRLGGVVPDIAGASPSGSGSSMTVPGAFPSSSSSTAAPPGSGPGWDMALTRFELDQTLPMTSIQIRLADGSRMVARLNLSHTIGDLRKYINASRPENGARAYTLQTTFPIKVLEDDSVTVEAAGLANSVIAQRWA